MAQPASVITRPRNHLLSTLSAEDFGLMRSRLEPIALSVRHVMEEPNRPIKHVYFPDAGIVSVVAISSRDRQVEVALIGQEGMTGIAIVMGDDRSPHATYVQVAGNGMRVSADHLRQAMRESASLQMCFLRFAQAYLIQTAHSAVANARGKIEEQLARWLLMAHDRLDGDELPLTHEFLALMLGVRRAGVTIALRGLERRQLIRMARKSIIVLDHDGLVEFANGLYGIPEAEYRRLTGWEGLGHLRAPGAGATGDAEADGAEFYRRAAIKLRLVATQFDNAEVKAELLGIAARFDKPRSSTRKRAAPMK